MTRLTISRKNLFASVAWRKFSLLAAARSACHCFLRRRWCTHWIESASDEISRVTPEVRAAEENRQSVDRDQPHRQRLGAYAWFAFLALHSSVHLLDIGLFAVIHSLPCARRRFRFVVHCIIFLRQQAIPQVRAKHLGSALPVMQQVPARLRLIWLLSTDAID